MKTVKIIICLLTMFLFCIVLSACAKENKEQAAQEEVYAEVEQKEKDSDADKQAEHERELYNYEEDAEEDGEEFFSDDVDDGGQAEREPELYESKEGAENVQHTGSYEHHIGDAVFYTEHDLQKYISPNPVNPVHNMIDIEAMLRDIWGTDGALQVSNGYSYSNGSDFYRGVQYDDINGDKVINRIIIGATLDRDYRTVITLSDTPKPDGGYWIIKGSSKGYGFMPDMAALLLYVLEQTELNPRSDIAGELGLPDNFECTY